MMKRFTTLVLGMCLLLVAVVAQERKDTKKQTPDVENRLAGREYRIDALCAYPMSGPSVMLSAQYSLRMAKDSVYVYLPYYGRAYSQPYGGGEGLIFRGKAEAYTQKAQKKGRYDISFSVRTQEDSYAFRLSVFKTGEASISVTMDRKQPISFTGNMAF